MQRIEADVVVSVSDLKRNPTAVVDQRVTVVVVAVGQRERSLVHDQAKKR